MIAEKKFCRRCHKKRSITNKGMGWCRACVEKVNDRYCHIKILKCPPKYDEILAMYKSGVPQIEIAKRTGRSRTGVQGICNRYTQRVDASGNVRPR